MWCCLTFGIFSSFFGASQKIRTRSSGRRDGNDVLTTVANCLSVQCSETIQLVTSPHTHQPSSASHRFFSSARNAQKKCGNEEQDKWHLRWLAAFSRKKIYGEKGGDRGNSSHIYFLGIHYNVVVCSKQHGNLQLIFGLNDL